MNASGQEQRAVWTLRLSEVVAILCSRSLIPPSRVELEKPVPLRVMPMRVCGVCVFARSLFFFFSSLYIVRVKSISE